MSRQITVEPSLPVPKQLEPGTVGTEYLSQPFIFNNLLIYIAYFARNYITRALSFLWVIEKDGSTVPRFHVPNDSCGMAPA